jgi:hypothetical protein
VRPSSASTKERAAQKTQMLSSKDDDANTIMNVTNIKVQSANATNRSGVNVSQNMNSD